MKTSEMLSVSGLAAVVGSVATMFTSSLTYFNSSRELDIRMVNVALTILSAKEKGTDTEQARRYALRALESYGGVDIPDSEFEQWAKTGTVPAGEFNWASGEALSLMMQMMMMMEQQKQQAVPPTPPKPDTSAP